MRGGCSGATVRVAALVYYQRFSGGCLCQHTSQTLAIGSALDIGRDDLCLWVVRKIVQQLALIYVTGIAVADILAEMQPPHHGTADDIGSVAAALGNEANGSTHLRVVETEAQPGRRAVQAHAIRTKNPDAVLPGFADQLVLQFHEFRFPGFGKPRRIELKDLGTNGMAVIEEFRGLTGRYARDHMIDWAGNVSKALVHWQPHYFAALGVYGIYLAWEAHLQQRLDVELVDKPSKRVSGGSSQGYRSGMEYELKRVLAVVVARGGRTHPSCANDANVIGVR